MSKSYRSLPFLDFFLAGRDLGIILHTLLTPYNAALGELARAESAQTPHEVILYLTIAMAQLPESATVAWWSAEKGDFESIQSELDDIIIRTRSISSLDSSNEHFVSGVLDIHARLETIEKDLVSF